jgi:hypothetical protein
MRNSHYSHGRSITLLFYQTITKTTGGFDETDVEKNKNKLKIGCVARR